MACRSESSTQPLLTSRRSAPRGSCSPRGSCDPGTCRRWRPSGRWKRSCSRPSRPGSGSPGCWKGTPPAAGLAGRPALRFHAEMGWRNRRPEAGGQETKRPLSPCDPSPACFCYSTHETHSGSLESQAGEDGEGVSGFFSFYPRGMAMAPGTLITAPVSSFVPGGQPLCTRLLLASSQTPGLLCLSTHLPYQGTPLPPAMTTRGHSLVPGTAGGLSKHQPSVCPASNLLLPEVCAEGTELAASSKPLLSSHASGPFRTLVPMPQIPLTHHLRSRNLLPSGHRPLHLPSLLPRPSLGWIPQVPGHFCPACYHTLSYKICRDGRASR